MKMCWTVFMLSVGASIAAMPHAARSQSLLAPNDPSATATVMASPPSDPIYSRPTHMVMVTNYVFDAFGPYPVVGAGVAAGIGQLSNAPPEWHQGAEGYAKRFGSDFGMAATATTTRYGLSEALKEDTLYYQCECSGVLPRLRHAVLSTVTARHGQDGHRTLSLSALLAPYAGSTVAVFGWYPDRFGAKDALRLGNYNLLAFIGGNIALEFLYKGPHSLLSRVHLNNGHGSPDLGPNH
ncbi:MAG: hypothetical protein P4L87_02905 [Formivibrio sp.]|nr:hypothetical protein [Formivibrio sp.]